MDGVIGLCFRLCRIARYWTKLAVANEQRAVVGDGLAMRPVPLNARLKLSQKTKKEKLLLRRVHQQAKLAMANEQRAVVGDGPAVRPVPLLLLTGFHYQKRKKTYDVLYIHRPSWVWQTNSVPLSETAPPCAQFHFFIFGYGMF